MRTCLFFGLVASIAQAADSAGHLQVPLRAIEVTSAPLNWLQVAIGVDDERTKTLRAWQQRYAADRAQPAPPYTVLKSLSTARTLDLSGVDACMARGEERELSFAQVLERNLNVALESRKISTNPYIDSPQNYNLLSNRVPVGFLSHAFCTFDSNRILSELEHSLAARVVPDANLAVQLNNYLLHSNFLRTKVLVANTGAAMREALSEFKAYQGILMSCLAYTESLSGTESSLGDEIYASLNRKAYVAKASRPAGVAFGVDRPADYYVGNRSRSEQISYGLTESMGTFTDVMGRSRSRYLKYTPALNAQLQAANSDQAKAQIKRNFVVGQLAAINSAKARGVSEAAIHAEFFSDISESKWFSAGVNQFKFGNMDTDKGDVLDSNIGPCVDQWNELYGRRCPIAHTVAGYAAALSSPGQAFNMFCGTQKVLQSFNVQVHTQNPQMTALQNTSPDGTLKAPANRCVHPFWRGGLAYNHFGPLANSAPKGSITGLKSFPGNLAIVNECIHNNGQRVFGER